MIYGIDSNSPTATLVGAIGALGTTEVPEWVWKTAGGQPSGGPVTFVLRYLTNHGTANMNTHEIQQLNDAGISVASIYEGGNTPDILTEANGYRTGTAAFEAAAAVNQPPGFPVYFAIDFSPTFAQLPLVTNYFDGVRRALDDYSAKNGSGGDVYAIGVYGQPHVCEHCRTTDATKSPGNKLALYYWRFGGHGPWAFANLHQWYGPNIYGSSSATAKDHSMHFFGKDGQIIGEKFCGLSVDFNTSDAASPEELGAWKMPLELRTE